MHYDKTHRHDEFSRFAQRFNAMAGEIAHHREHEVEVRHRLEDLVAVSFVPEEAYDQTPGPRAGSALGGTR